MNSITGYATGLDRVPYNDTIVRLHEGERVLTKVEADKQDRYSINIPKLADLIIIKEEADTERIISHLASELRKHVINMA